MARSSDYDTWQRDPFEYYLRIRLGLTHPFQVSDALGYGTWLHTAHECHAHALVPPAAKPTDTYLSVLGVKQNELCEVEGVSASRLEAAIEREDKRAREAWIWYHAAMNLPLPGRNRTTAWDLLNQNACIATELELSVTLFDHPCCIAIDDLRYNPTKKELEIWDLKSTGGSVTQRLTACPFEFASVLYRAVVEADLAKGAQSVLRNLVTSRGFDGFNIKLGCFKHLVVRKPTIHFGRNDRPFTVTSRTITRGARKGQTVVEKEYTGDPSYEIYLDRCKDWYYGEGDFLEQKQARVDDPVVNISEVRWSSPDLFTPESRRQLDDLVRAATCDACPDNFPRSARNFLDQSEDWLYAPFYTQPVRRWPEIIRELGLTQHWRSPLP